MSTSPGARQAPPASITRHVLGASTVRPERGDPLVLDQQRPALVEAGRRVEQAGVLDQGAGLGHRAGGGAQLAGQHVEAGHAHRDPDLDLVQDGAPIDVVGDHAIDLDPTVHRPGMHDQGVRPGHLRSLLVGQAEEVEILAHRRHEAALHALGLQAQHHDDVGAFEAARHVVKSSTAEAREAHAAAGSAAPPGGPGRPWR